MLKAHSGYRQELNEQARMFHNLNLCKLSFEAFKQYTVESQYESELDQTADIFRKKKMMRRWRRAFLNVNVAKHSFEVGSDFRDQNAPTITDLLSIAKNGPKTVNPTGSMI